MAPTAAVVAPRRRRTTTATNSLACLVIFAAIVFGINYYNNKVMKQVRNQQQQKEKEASSSSSNTSPEQQEPWKLELLARLDRIRQVCGDLCNMNDAEQIKAHTVANTKESSNFPSLQVPHVNCSAIIGSEDIDASDWTFPTTIPDELMPYFTVHGGIKFQNVRIYQRQYQGGEAMTTKWTQADLEERKKNAMKDMPTLRGTYSVLATRMVREKLRHLKLNQKSVLVIGSETPWVEAICLGLGAALVTTLEYGRIESTHPQVKTLTPAEFRTLYQDGTLGQFDVVVSHSSLEHSGMGRYGDALNPWGDILAVTRAWCVTKPGGGLYLGLPTGKDKIVFNAHRVYGKVRWPLITTNWQQVDANNHTNDEFEQDVGIDVRYGGTGFIFRKAKLAATASG